jgi:D-arabinan exo alpha-(1,3)/(1,5)-arabinofuranosidase (non-reducing end)
MSFVQRGCGSPWRLKPLRRRDGGGTVAESRSIGRRGLVAIVVMVAGVSVLGGCAQSTGGERQQKPPAAQARVFPWEWWRDLSSVTRVPDGDRVVMRSSHCPSGCEFDRHSAGDSRFISVRENGEGVIFKTEGAGAVTRIWMVMGDGVSEPLDPSIRLRIRVDGRSRPVVDLPLPEVFAGSTRPFLAPMVEDAAASGGGNVSYVPIPFRDGCEISLVGADVAKIWFQVVARIVEDPSGIRSFTGRESLESLQNVLARAGSDPWSKSSDSKINGTVRMAPGDGRVIATLEGPDMINGVIIRAARKNWPRLGLRFTFDGGEPQLIPVLDLFGRPGTDGGMARSVFFGVDDETDLYCYFPMPFFQRAEVELLRRPVEGPGLVKVEYALRTAGVPPPDDAGYFGVDFRRSRGTTPGETLPLLELEGRGVVVGLVAELSPMTGKRWTHLEGDERIFIDGEEEPSWHGTGVEDLFNGGFYFRGAAGHPAPFVSALAGAPDLRGSYARAVMYRLFLGDAVVFQGGIRAELETGPRGETSIRARTVAFYYSAREDNGEPIPLPGG